MTEDRLMSLFLVMMAAWFLYARYQESKLLLHAATAQRSVSDKDMFGPYNNINNRISYTNKIDPTLPLNNNKNNNNNNNNSDITSTAASHTNSDFYPTTDDDEISTSTYLRRRESGSGGGFMPQELKELLVMGGVDKGPPPHFSSDHRTNKYRKAPNTLKQYNGEVKVSSSSLETLDLPKVS
jgi:hypothetical protein